MGMQACLPLRDNDFPRLNLKFASQPSVVTSLAGRGTRALDLVFPATFTRSRDSLLCTSLIMMFLLH